MRHPDYRHMKFPGFGAGWRRCTQFLVHFLLRLTLIRRSFESTGDSLRCDKSGVIHNRKCAIDQHGERGWTATMFRLRVDSCVDGVDGCRLVVLVFSRSRLKRRVCVVDVSTFVEIDYIEWKIENMLVKLHSVRCTRIKWAITLHDLALVPSTTLLAKSCKCSPLTILIIYSRTLLFVATEMCTSGRRLHVCHARPEIYYSSHSWTRASIRYITY